MEQAINFFRAHFGQASSTTSQSRIETNEFVPADAAPVISVKRKRVVNALIFLAAVLFAANLAVLFADYMTGYEVKTVERLAKVFSVDRELNAPAFFSTLILLFSSGLLAVIAYLKQKGRDQYIWHWAILSAGFLFMAYDEMASAHEKLIEPLRSALGEKATGMFYFAWVVPGIVLVAVIGFLFLRFWWKLPSTTRIWFFIAGIVYLSGALGMELIDGSYASAFGKENLAYKLLSTFEESLEVTGVIIFIHGLLGYLSETAKILVCRLDGAAERGGDATS